MPNFACLRAPVLALAVLAGAPCLSQARESLEIKDKIVGLERLSNAEAAITGRAELHLSSPQPITDSVVDLRSEDSWLFLKGVRVSAAGETLLAQVRVAGAKAVAGENVRVAQYGSGSAIIPHPPDYLPLEIFGGPGMAGESARVGIYDERPGPRILKPLRGKAGSLRLKRGYMATLASRRNGAGFSKVYVAQDADLIVARLPAKLADRVKFVRVIPWRWTGKKGWSGARVNEINLDWHYDWDNVALSTPDTEYVPMRHNKHWNAFEHINEKKGSTHALAFNEPDKSDQAHMTVAEALKQWPRLLESGLRLGSPAPSDGGLNWLYEFLDRADALNYRVDFVAVHYYKGGWTAEQYRRWLEGIHRRTGRPIWITEFNNGANWTPPEPSREENALRIREFIKMLDEAEFVERYAIYNWVGKGRELVSNFKPVELTEAGEFYRDHRAPIAYRDPGPPPAAPSGFNAKPVSGMRMDLSWRDESENETGFRIERREGRKPFRPIASLPAGTTVFSDGALAATREYGYRIRAYNAAGESANTESGRARTLPGVGIVPPEEIRVRRADSEETKAADNPAERVLDGNRNTFWHTRWRGEAPRHPHEIELDLREVRRIHGVRYLPRQDGNPNGTILAYRIFVSESRKKWGDPVTEGTWEKNINEKEARFSPIKGRFVRLVADSEINSGPWTSAAEIRILAE